MAKDCGCTPRKKKTSRKLDWEDGWYLKDGQNNIIDKDLKKKHKLRVELMIIDWRQKYLKEYKFLQAIKVQGGYIKATRII